jgi:hypothetical protein
LAHPLWTQKQNFGPSARSGHALAFDTNRSRVVLFGGVLNMTPPETFFGDTWQWDGGNWTETANIGPAPRGSFAMAYDRNRSRLVLFGGISTNTIFGDTWEWDGQDWTQVSESGPSLRSLHAMAFDSSKNVVTLFGGQSQPLGGKSSVLGDTWEWDGQNWTQQDDKGPARSSHAVAYDDTRKRLVLFGGSDGQGQVLGDTWEWDGAAWIQRAVIGPPLSSLASLVFTGAQCVLFGGNQGGVASQQTWLWDGTHWTESQTIGPGARQAHGMAFDSVRQRIVLFGGQDQAASFFFDTWERAADAPPAPPPVQGPTLTSFTVVFPQAAKGATSVVGVATFQLSAPASADGVLVTLGPAPGAVNTLQQNQQATIPAGQATLQIPVGLDLAGFSGTTTLTFLASLQNGSSLQATAQVTLNP